MMIAAAAARCFVNTGGYGGTTSQPGRLGTGAATPAPVKRASVSYRTPTATTTATTTLTSNARTFSTSARRLVNPLLWVFVKPLAKVVAMVSARRFRLWWRGLEAEEKLRYRGQAFTRRHWLFTGCTLASLALTANYVAHLELAPVTNRRRYIGFSRTQMADMSTYCLEDILEETEGRLIPAGDRRCHRVSRIAQHLLESNRDIEFMNSQQWKIHVVDDKSQNAFVLPTGDIFVYSGLLSMIQNDDQLAVVLAHEMSHAILNHSAEQVSVTQAIDLLMIMLCAAVWAFLPSDAFALFGQWINHHIVKILLNLPYSRKLETEADEVGLHLMAKACYDTRETSNFWMLMSILEHEDDKKPEFLSTHPNHENRAVYLDGLITEANVLRKACNCAKLSLDDPREGIEFLRRIKNDV